MMSEEASTVNVGGYHVHLVRIIVQIEHFFWVYCVKGLQALSERVFWYSASLVERFVPEYRGDIDKYD